MNPFSQPRRSLVALLIILLSIGPAAKISAAPELVVKAELLEKSPVPEKKRLGVYREGLVNYLWEVKDVEAGELENLMEGELPGQKILVSHYGVYDTLEQDVTEWKPGATKTLTLNLFNEVREIETLFMSDRWDLDFELRRFHHVDQELERPKPDKTRFDYGKSDYSEKLATLVGLRNQLKIVSIGDSQTAEGLVAGAFYPVQNTFYPVGYNAAIGSQRLNWARLIVEDYLIEMPDLEWLVLGINPRMFSENKADIEPHPARDTPGHQADRKLAKMGWPMMEQRVTYRVESNMLPNRYEKHRIGHLRNTDPGKMDNDGGRIAEKRIRKKYHQGNGFPKEWHISERARELFENVLKKARQEGYRVFAFIPPINPVVTKYPEIVDEDHTTPEGYDRLVKYLERLEEENPHYLFEDISRKGNHFLSPNHFRDTDHLQDMGAMKLTAHIWRLLTEGVARPKMRVDREGAEISLSTGADDPVWMLSDGAILEGKKVRHTFRRPGVYLVALNGREGHNPSSSAWQRVEIPVSAFDEPVEDSNHEIEVVLRIHEDFQRAPRMIFADGAACDDTEVVTWDFGDGTTAAGPFVQHIYDKPGAYEITLTAYNEDGLVKSGTKKVRVR